MSALLALPIVLPLAAAAVSQTVRGWIAAQRALAVATMAGELGVSIAILARVERGGIQATQMGAWPAPYGITLVADLFGGLMLVVASGVGLAVAVYSLFDIDERRAATGFYPLFHVLMAGVCGAFLTGDLFNLYVWFEVMLMASFVLLALGGGRDQLEGAIPYVVLNLLASAFFLAAVGILYGVVGTLNFADLSAKLARTAHPELITAVGMLFLVAFGIKAAVFPMFFWLPASYHVPPVSVSALFAGLLTKVGVYALFRVYTLLFTHEPEITSPLLLAISGLTMVTGVLGAAAQNEIRRVLSFHIVSQIGYMTAGLGLAGSAVASGAPALAGFALGGSIFYIVHHIIVKTNLFLISGVAYRLLGRVDLKRMGGLYATRPGVALLFLIPAMSLAGIPPLSGFWAKLAVVRAGLDAGQYALVATALFVGLLTLFSMTKVWNEAFWKPRPDDLPPPGEDGSPRVAGLLVPIACLAGLTVLIGAAAEPLFALALRAGEQLADPSAYVRAVLGDPP